MSDMIPRGMSKMMRKAAPKRKHGAAKISKKTKEKIRPKEDVGKFIAKKVKFLVEKEGLSQKHALGKAFGIARTLGFNVPEKK